MNRHLRADALSSVKEDNQTNSNIFSANDSLFVGNLAYDADDEELREALDGRLRAEEELASVRVGDVRVLRDRIT